MATQSRESSCSYTAKGGRLIIVILTQPISDFLDRGKENAIPGKDIARVLGVDLRTITRAIEQERRAGTPICANTDTEQGQQGYYLPANQAELDEYCNSLKRRAIEIFKTRQAILKAREKAGGVLYE